MTVETAPTTMTAETAPTPMTAETHPPTKRTVKVYKRCKGTKVLMGVAAIVIIYFIVSAACGGLDWKNCV